jgi:pheromone shutdown protein TraB
VADEERVRVEVAFDGGAIIGILVASEAADELERALASTAQEVIAVEADDGRYTVALKRVLYVKRFNRESRVGFGSG